MNRIDHPPKCTALLVCREVRESAGKTDDVLGIITTLASQSFPTRGAAFVVAIETSGGFGIWRMRVLILSPSNNEFDASETTVEFDGESVNNFSSIAFDDFSFPRPGTYRIQLWANDVLLMERPLLVVESAHE